jgi:putative FmdB family regulatory protein
MPIYEYRCAQCGHQQESLQKVTDAPLTVCPKCHQPALAKMVTAAGFQLKGSGWYATDFKGKGSATPAKSDAAKSEGGGSSKGSDSKGSDSKGSDSKGSDSKGSDSKASDSKASDSKGSDSKGETKASAPAGSGTA